MPSPVLPAIVLASSNDETRTFLGGMLERRFGADYSIALADSAADVIRRLVGYRDARKPVALVICSSFLEGSNGIEMLSEVHSIHPHAGRILLTRWGDREAAKIILQAMTLGRVDDAVYVPTTSPDEAFYRRLTEHLEEWSQEQGPHLEILRIVDHARSRRGHELREGLERNRVPFRFIRADDDEGRSLTATHGADALPLVLLADGRVLRNPSNLAIAEALEVNSTIQNDILDYAVVGAGPAGLATAVYAASEGMRTLVIEPWTLGGQAGASSRIRNYPGFPRGISGADLADRFYQQAWFFGAGFIFAQHVRRLEAGDDCYELTIDDGRVVRARGVVLACGVAYRPLGIPNVERFNGAGVFYGAATTEARALEGTRVCVAGGGNSAGQAVVHLAKFATHVDLLVRGTALTGNMSQYLMQELEDLPNVTIRFNTEVVDAVGDQVLEGLVLHDGMTGETRTEPSAALFVFIGAQPHTRWLSPAVHCDKQGYILTGTELLRDGEPPEDWPLKRRPFPFETNLPGVFAVGDVRHGSIKRVTSAVGEGAMAIPYLHAWIAEVNARQRRRGPLSRGARGLAHPPAGSESAGSSLH